MYKLNRQARIFISGHNGMVGSATLRSFTEEGYSNLLTKNRKELDLLNQEAVNHFFQKERPEIVILSAARVGGIQANIDNPATFLYDNLVIQNNIVDAAY